MQHRGDLLARLRRTINRPTFVWLLLLGVFAAVVPSSAGTLASWSGSKSLPSGYTIAGDDVVELDPEVDTTVTLGGNLIVGGVLRSKPAPGVTHVIRFSGIDESKFIGGGNEPIASDTGLWVVGDGRLDLAGADKVAWTRASGSLLAGATAATLDVVPAGWQPGDEILIAPTENPKVPGFSIRHEVRTLTWVDGSSVGFSGLAYPHPKVTVKPGVSYGPEIVNLTRSVRIEGQDATHRTHVWLKSSVPQSIRNVAIRYAGPQKGSPADAVLGRYGLHFHRMGEGSRNSLVEGVIVRQTGGPAFAVHQSNGVTLRNTASFDTQSAAYWYDPGAAEAPNDALYDGALAAYVRPTPKQYPGYRLTAFMLGRGTGNGCVRCVAFGVQGGKNASGFGWPEGQIGIWRFEDAVAHNNARNGIFVWHNGTSGHFIDRFVGYYNGFSGVEHGAYTNAYHYRDNVLYGNRTTGVYLHASSPDKGELTTFERPYVDGAGMTANAVLLAKPTNPDQPPSLWCGATILNLTGAPFAVSYTGVDSTVAERLSILPVCPADLPSPPLPGSPPAPPVPVPTKGPKGSKPKPKPGPTQKPPPSPSLVRPTPISPPTAPPTPPPKKR